MASKLLSLRRFSTVRKPLLPSPPSLPFSSSYLLNHSSRSLLPEDSRPQHPNPVPNNRNRPPCAYCSISLFCSRAAEPESEGPTAIDYRSILQEDEFHKLADSTIHDLQEKFEEYGDSVQIDGFDIDYGNEVLTLKLGDLGTYVLNKQTPNRQLWLSSPVSGPSRFDWDQNAQAWIYRRTKANLLNIFESELEQLCGEPIKLA